MNHSSNWTGRTARTTTEALGCTGIAIELHRPPLWKRAIWATCRHGWIAILAFLVAALFWQGLQGPSDVQAAQDVADEVRAVESRK